MSVLNGFYALFAATKRERKYGKIYYKIVRTPNDVLPAAI